MAVTDEQRAYELVESARKKLKRAAALVPELAVEFADAVEGVEELADSFEDDDPDEQDPGD